MLDPNVGAIDIDKDKDKDKDKKERNIYINYC